jgi:hypothetical protein
MRAGLYAGAVASILFAAAWALSAAALRRFAEATSVISGDTLGGVQGSASIAFWAVGLLLGATVALCIFGIAVYRYSRGRSVIERVAGIAASVCAIGYTVFQVTGGALYVIGYSTLIKAIGSFGAGSISDALARYPVAAKQLGAGLVLQALALIALILLMLALATLLFGRARTGKALGIAGVAIIASFFISFLLGSGVVVGAEIATLAAALAWLLVVSVYLARPTVARTVTITALMVL